jgi:lipoprotein-anchoring transpeptidase ErfK/SrfK
VRPPLQQGRSEAQVLERAAIAARSPGLSRSELETVTGSFRRRGLAFLAGLLLLAATGTGAAATSASVAVVKPTQNLTTLLKSHEAFSRPTPGSKSLGLVAALRPITEEQTVLPVLGHRTGADGRRWLLVRLPGRPNGRTGWISSRGTLASATPWHIIVSTSGRRVSVYRGGRAVRVFRAVVGKPSTPTPQGEFFVEETIKLPPDAVGAPFALALSARSNVLQEFDGGPGQIALHGLRNVGGTLGTAVSHGCVRLETSAMRWLVARIGTGVPVTITG